MNDALTAAILGIVEGLTEFIPVSSTGHLILAGDILRGSGAAGFWDSFEIFIQLGAILAVITAFPSRFAGLARLDRFEGFQGLRGWGLLACTSFPALLLGFLAHSWLKEHLFRPIPVAAALAAGAVWMLLADRKNSQRAAAPVTDVQQMAWSRALLIGCFQCLALWPGMSRSVSTILGGMHVGLDRRTATEYSFFAGVPVLAIAALYSLKEAWGTLNASSLGIFGVGFIVSMICAFLTVKWLVHYVARHTLHVFAWYRLALAAVVVAVSSFR